MAEQQSGGLQENPDIGAMATLRVKLNEALIIAARARAPLPVLDGLLDTLRAIEDAANAPRRH